jgi:hypothetical protein
MSGRPGAKSLADQQNEFKRALLSSSTVKQGIAEARSNSPTTMATRNHAYGRRERGIIIPFLNFSYLDHLKATSVGELHINSYIFSIISYLKVYTIGSHCIMQYFLSFAFKGKRP